MNRYMIQHRKNINMLYMQMLMKRFLLKNLCKNKLESG